jgi:hypothetical protein
VLQGSKVILDVEEEGLDKRTILSLDAAAEISSSGITCFRFSDGKEHCFADAEPGECNSFAGSDGSRGLLNDLRKKKVAVAEPKEEANPIIPNAPRPSHTDPRPNHTDYGEEAKPMAHAKLTPRPNDDESTP